MVTLKRWLNTRVFLEPGLEDAATGAAFWIPNYQDESIESSAIEFSSIKTLFWGPRFINDFSDTDEFIGYIDSYLEINSDNFYLAYAKNDVARSSIQKKVAPGGILFALDAGNYSFDNKGLFHNDFRYALSIPAGAQVSTSGVGQDLNIVFSSGAFQARYEDDSTEFYNENTDGEVTLRLFGENVGLLEATVGLNKKQMLAGGFDIRYMSEGKTIRLWGRVTKFVARTRVLPIMPDENYDRLILETVAHPFRPELTKLFLSSSSGEKKIRSLKSNFFSSHGHSVRLIPVPLAPDNGGSPCFRLSPQAQKFDQRPGDRTDWASMQLQGAFDVELEGISSFKSKAIDGEEFVPAAENLGVVLGLRNGENASLSAEGQGRIVFEPYLPALRPNEGEKFFEVADQAASEDASDDIDEKPILVNLKSGQSGIAAHSTSWVRFETREGKESTVVAEAENFKTLTEVDIGEISNNIADRRLKHTPLRLFQAGPEIEDRVAIPVLPFAEEPVVEMPKDKSDPKYKSPSFESIFLSRERRKYLTPFSEHEQSLELKKSLDKVVSFRETPLGFELDTVNGKPEKIVFARTRSGNTELECALQNQGEARKTVDAVMREKLFIVANKLSASDEFKFLIRMNIANWGFEFPFQLDSESEENDVELDRDALIIIKGVSGKLMDLMKAPGLWTSKSNFLSGNTASSRIAKAKEAFDHAVEAAEQIKAEFDEQYGVGARNPADRFLELIDDPEFYGVIILKTPVLPADLPDQIKGLMGGLDKPLRAHHLGIDLRRRDTDENGEQGKESALFGLVYHAADDDTPKLSGNPAEQASDAQWRFESEQDAFGLSVNRLYVEFSNSEIEVFRARIRVAIDEVFGYKIDLTGNDPEEDPYFELEGAYETKIVGGQRVESYSFLAIVDRVRKFGEKAIFDEIKISSLGFKTESVYVVGGETRVETRLIADAEVKFGNIGEENLLGISGVRCRNLGIELDFNLKEVVDQIFCRFSASGLTINFDEADLGDSIFSSLPFKLRAFEWWENGVDLDRLGFFKLLSNGDEHKTDVMLNYGLMFNLDLGSLGAIAKDLGDFKFDLLFGWKHGRGDPGDSEKGTNWSFGMKFSGAGGNELDLGIQDVIRLRARRYGLSKIKSGPAEGMYFLYGLDTQLKLFDTPIPLEGNMSVFLFVDPKSLFDTGKRSPIGWFTSFSNQNDSNGFLKLPYMALGQRVNPFPEGTELNTRQLVDEVGKLSDFGAKDPDKAPEDALNEIVAQMGGTNPPIRYDSSAGWTVAFRSILFDGDFVNFDFVMNDPSLYGARLEFPIFGDFSIDIVYRKLSDSLGVYSTEVELPSNWRQWEFGAASLTVPIIGLDIYTDGGFNIDVGFPYNQNFARSFTLQIFPFIGGGGVYFGRLNGAGSRYIPSPVKVNQYGEYNPVTQLGVGFRIGLGKEISKGPLRAGLSVCVFGYLEGAWGKLNKVGPSDALAPRREYAVYTGVVGIIGEIYGYVDFRIVKAGVSVRVVVAVGVVFETDRSTRLYLQARVSVRVSVVVGRIKIFGKKIEIRVSFSFSTGISYSWKTGQDRLGYDQIYTRRGRAGLKLLADDTNKLVHARGIDLAIESLRWSGYSVSPHEWRCDNNPNKVKLPAYFLPDITFASNTVAQGAPLLEGVLLLALETRAPDDDKEINVTPYELLCRGLIYWAIKSAVEKPEELSIDDEFDLEAIEEILAKYTGGRDNNQASAPITDLPNYQQIKAFFQNNFDLEISAVPDGGEMKEMAPFPMPSEVTVSYGPNFETDVKLGEVSRAGDEYEAAIERNFEKFSINLSNRENDLNLKQSVSTDKPLTEILFEEQIAMLIRTSLSAIRDILLGLTADSKPKNSLRDLLAFFEHSKGVSKAQTTGVPVRPAADAIAFSTRMFMYGLTLPKGHNLKAIPARLENAAMDAFGVYRLAGLQVPLSENSQIKLETGSSSWFDIKNDTKVKIDSAEYKDLVKINLLDHLSSEDRIIAPAATAELYGSWHGKRSSPSSRYDLYTSHPGNSNSSPNHHLLVLPVDIREDYADEAKRSAIHARNVEVATNGVQEDASKTTVDFKWTTVIEIPLSRIASRKSDSDGVPELVQGLFEIGSMSEATHINLQKVKAAADQGLPLRLNIYRQLEETDSASTDKYISPEKRVLIDTATFPVSLLRSNLTSQAKPSDENIIKPFGLETESDPSRRHSVRLPDHSNNEFLDLLLKASTTNAGGYYISWPNAEEQMQSLFEIAEKGGVGESSPSILLVIEWTDNSALPQDANSALFAQNSIPLLEKTFDEEDGDAERKAIVFESKDNQNFEAAHEPGVLPLEMHVKNPDLLITYGESIGYEDVRRNISEKINRAENSDDVYSILKTSGAQISEIAQRFTMLDYEVQTIDADGNPVKIVDFTESLPIGPIAPDPDLKDHDAKEHLAYRLSLPASKLIDAKADFEDSLTESNPYQHIGRKFIIWFRLRDVYGNSLGIGAPKRLDTVLPYTDRLISFDELSGLDFWYEPTESKARLDLRMSFQLANVFPVPGEIVNEKSIAAALEMLDRVHRQWKRFSQQVADEGLSFDFSWSAAGTATPQKNFRNILTAYCSTVLKLIEQAIGHLKDFDETAENPWQELYSLVYQKVDTKGVRIPRDNPAPRVRIDIGSKKDWSFCELDMTFILKRNEKFVPQSLRAEKCGVWYAKCQVKLGRNAKSTEIPLETWQRAFRVVLGEQELALATGASDHNLNRSGAFWLISGKVMESVSGWENKLQTMDLGLRPLSTSLESFSLENVPVYGKNERSMELVNQDLDEIGRTVVSRLDYVAAPDLVADLIHKKSGQFDYIELHEEFMIGLEKVAEMFSEAVVWPVRKNDVSDPDFQKFSRVAKQTLNDRMKSNASALYQLDGAIGFALENISKSNFNGHEPQVYAKVSSLNRTRASYYSSNVKLTGDDAGLFAVFIDILGNDTGVHKDKLKIELTHIQRDAETSDYFDATRKLGWLRLTTPVTIERDIDVPIPTREFPDTPVFEVQRALPRAYATPESDDDLIGALKQWDYIIEWRRSSAVRQQTSIAGGAKSPIISNDVVQVDLFFNADPDNSEALEEIERRLKNEALPEWPKEASKVFDRELMNRLVIFAKSTETALDQLALGEPAAFKFFLDRLSELVQTRQKMTLTPASLPSLALKILYDRYLVGESFPSTGTKLKLSFVPKTTLVESGGKASLSTFVGNSKTAKASDIVRSLTVSNLSATHAVCGWGGGRTIRNSVFNGDAGPEYYADEFVYFGVPARSANSVVPRIYITEEIRMPTFGEATIKGALYNFLKRFLHQSGAVTLQNSKFQYDVHLGYDSLKLARYYNNEVSDPLLIQAFLGLTLHQDEAEKHAELFDNAFDTWKRQNVVQGKIGCLVLDVRVFAPRGLGRRYAEKPLLRINRLRIDLDEY